MEYVISQESSMNGTNIQCPCFKCENGKFWNAETVKLHLLKKGFVRDYYVWDRHGEPYVARQSGEQSSTHYSNTQGRRDGENQMYNIVMDVAGPSFDPEMPNAEAQKLYDILKSSERELYEGCETSQLSAMAQMLSLKSDHHWSKACFDQTSRFFKDILPQDNSFLDSFYSTKKYMEELGLPSEHIDCCVNGCMIYWGEDINMESYSEEWKQFDKAHPSFSSEVRNVRLGLSADGFQPFGETDESEDEEEVVWIDKKSQQTYETFLKLRELHEATGQPVDNNALFLEAVGGLDKKKRVYGVGSSKRLFYRSMNKPCTSSFAFAGEEENQRLKRQLLEMNEQMKAMENQLARIIDATSVRLQCDQSPANLDGENDDNYEGNAGKLAFLEVNDGSCSDNIQLVVESSLHWPSHLTPTGTSVYVEGELVMPPKTNKYQKIELKVTRVINVGSVDSTYPLPKGKFSPESIRNIPHLRYRTDIVLARVRNALAHATHRFFQMHDFLYIHTPIITTNDCEGGGEMFQVTTLLTDAQKLDKQLLNNPPPSPAHLQEATSLVNDKADVVSQLKAGASSETYESQITNQNLSKLEQRSKLKPGIPIKDGKIDYSTDFFARPSYLTVSGQLHAETCASVFIPLDQHFELSPLTPLGIWQSSGWWNQRWHLPLLRSTENQTVNDSMNMTADPNAQITGSDGVHQ
ncbi:hypothetical protein AgCh_020898 [Apium graveolens]